MNGRLVFNALVNLILIGKEDDYDIYNFEPSNLTIEEVRVIAFNESETILKDTVQIQ